MTRVDSKVLKLRLPTPFPVGRVNVYFIDGTEPTLIDTGVFSSKSMKALKEQLLEHGRHMEDIRRIIITHDHYDHAGAALHLSQLCKATLYLHEKSSLFSKFQAEVNERTSKFLVRCGVPEDLVRMAFKMYATSEKFADLEAKAYAIKWLQGGETILCNDMLLKVLATPGHSPDHLSFQDADAGVLFCGDMLLPHITPNPLLYLDPQDGYNRMHSLLNYIDSLQKLEACDITIGCPGHGPDITDVPGLIATNKAFIEQRKNLFLEKINDGLMIPFELACAIFGELDMMNQYLAVSETVAYLDLLERDKMITVDWEGEAITFKLLL